MMKDILHMTPMRFFDFWKVNGQPPFCLVTVASLSGFYDLDRISSFIWIHLDGLHTVDNIITEICNIFTDVKREQATQDVIALLKRMDEDDLIILNYNSLHPYKKLKTYQRKNNHKTKERQNEVKRQKADK